MASSTVTALPPELMPASENFPDSPVNHTRFPVLKPCGCAVVNTVGLPGPSVTAT